MNARQVLGNAFGCNFEARWLEKADGGAWWQARVTRDGAVCAMPSGALTKAECLIGMVLAVTAACSMAIERELRTEELSSH